MIARWPPPSVGDIVWCHFPELPSLEPGPKPRPALIVRVETRTDGCNVQVAYGTSKRVSQLKSGEFAITRSTHRAAFALAGLAFDTKFNCRALVDLSWSERFFKVPPRPAYGQTPKLGTLHATVFRAAHAAFLAAQA